MTWSHQFVELDKSSHSRETFNSGKPELDDYLKTKALKHMSAGINRTLLLPSKLTNKDTGKLEVCAFFSVAPSSIARDDLPAQLAKKLPHYPIPVFLIAQLAVAQELQGQGLGKITLIKSLEYLHKVSKKMPAYAVIVDCLDENAESFYKQYNFQLLTENNGRKRLFLPMKTIDLLFE